MWQPAETTNTASTRQPATCNRAVGTRGMKGASQGACNSGAELPRSYGPPSNVACDLATCGKGATSSVAERPQGWEEFAGSSEQGRQPGQAGVILPVPIHYDPRCRDAYASRSPNSFSAT